MQSACKIESKSIANMQEGGCTENSRPAEIDEDFFTRFKSFGFDYKSRFRYDS